MCNAGLLVDRLLAAFFRSAGSAQTFSRLLQKSVAALAAGMIHSAVGVGGVRAMRGREAGSDNLFSYVRLEERVPAAHPLRPIRALTDDVLAGLNGRFEGLYSGLGRPSIPPEMLLRATLLQAFFSVRSERMLMEQIAYNLLFLSLIHI